MPGIPACSPQVLACHSTSATLKGSSQMGQDTQVSGDVSASGEEGQAASGSSSPQQEACRGSRSRLKRPAERGDDTVVPGFLVLV